MAKREEQLPLEKSDIKIFVIDDSDFSRKSIISILEDDGYKIVGESNSASDAISNIGNTSTNIFILDVVMPEISGIEFLQYLNEQKVEAKVIMISSLGLENIVLEAISNGAVDFIHKPFDKKELLLSVEKAVTRLE